MIYSINYITHSSTYAKYRPNTYKGHKVSVNACDSNYGGWAKVMENAKTVVKKSRRKKANKNAPENMKSR